MKQNKVDFTDQQAREIQEEPENGGADYVEIKFARNYVFQYLRKSNGAIVK